MSDHQYKFNVTMTCGGCSGAVERILKRLEGVYTLEIRNPRLPPLSIPRRSEPRRCCPFDVSRSRSSLIGVKTFDVSLESQTANITTEPTVSYDTVLAAIKKTGKTVNSGEADGQTMSV